MPNTEKQLLEKALGLDLTAIALDWPAFRAQHHIAHDTPADDDADRAFFTWQHFRSRHQPQSCLLDDEGRVRGLIVKGTDLTQLRIPALPALEYLCVVENKQLQEIELEGTEYPLLQHVDWSNNALKRIALHTVLPLLRYLSVARNKVKTMDLPDALPALEELDASKNQIKDCTLPNTLDALRYLFLNENGMTALQTNAALRELRTLHLKSNQLTRLPGGIYPPGDALCGR